MTAERRTPAGATTTDIDTAAFLRLVGRRIRLARLGRELTQDQLAAATGISRSFISLMEKGTHGVDVVRLYRLAAVLGTPLPELLTFPLHPATGGTPVRRGLERKEVGDGSVTG